MHARPQFREILIAQKMTRWLRIAKLSAYCVQVSRQPAHGRTTGVSALGIRSSCNASD